MVSTAAFLNESDILFTTCFLMFAGMGLEDAKHENDVSQPFAVRFRVEARASSLHDGLSCFLMFATMGLEDAELE